ncbi:DNA polymerase III subunit gamma/tau [Flavobacterium psychrophilum]|nr:DNA polymerase III subunit gamma/tau [Flavobacterium psychrophilum]
MEKKKAKQYIISPTYYRNSGFSIVEIQKVNLDSEDKSQKSDIEVVNTIDLVTPKNPEVLPGVVNSVNILTPKSEIANQQSTILGPKVSALSMKSIQAKRALEAQLKPKEKHHDELPTEPFTETQMLEQWVKYANRLGNKGYKILESLLLLDDPKLAGTTIIHELPNESSKIDFDGEKHDLLGYLRGKLHNHNITIEIKINETIETKKAFTIQEKYDRLKEINPALELLRKAFDLDL